MANLEQETQTAIAISRSFRKLADRTMDVAHDQLGAGKITLDQYYTISDRYQYLVHQANLITYEADRLIGQNLQKEFADIEQLSRGLDASFQRLVRVENILKISMKLFVAVGSVALAVINPGLGTLGAAGAALVDAATTLGEEGT